MDFTINNIPFEDYFGENVILQSVATCFKYYVGTTLFVSSSCGLIGGMIGGVIGSITGGTIAIATPILLINYVRNI